MATVASAYSRQATVVAIVASTIASCIHHISISCCVTVSSQYMSTG